MAVLSLLANNFSVICTCFAELHCNGHPRHVLARTTSLLYQIWRNILTTKWAFCTRKRQKKKWILFSNLETFSVKQENTHLLQKNINKKK